MSSGTAWTETEIGILKALGRLGAGRADIQEAMAAAGHPRTDIAIRRASGKHLGETWQTRRQGYGHARHAAALAALRSGTRSGLVLALKVLKVPAEIDAPAETAAPRQDLEPWDLPESLSARRARVDAKLAHALIVARHIARTCPWTRRQEAA